MAKSVLQYVPKGIPAKRDLVSYNKQTSCWEEITQANFLAPCNLKIKQTNARIDELEDKISELEKTISGLNDKIKYLASLEKESISW